MSDEIELVEEPSAERIAYQAKEVQQLLQQPLVQRALAESEAAILRHWKAATDPLAREMVWHDWKAHERFVKKLEILSKRPPLHIED